jgi:hypothetical protein
MTLNITVLTPDVIYQSADFRLTNADTGTWITDASRKLISLQYSDWDGLITYTGLGRWRGRDVSQWIADWVTGVNDATPDWMAARIAERGDLLLNEVLARTGTRFRHTFVLAAFIAGRVHAYLISNFENGRSRPRASADPLLQVTPLVLSTYRRSRVVVTGASTAVTRVQRGQLERLVAAHPGEGTRLRHALERINAVAANTPQAAGLISPECVVVSFRSDGAGFINLTGGAGSGFQRISNGMDVNKFVTDALKNIGIDLEKVQLVGGAFAASGRARASSRVLSCAPQVLVPDGSRGYEIIEITSPDFEARSAQGLNNNGVVVGTGGQIGGPTSMPWQWNGGRLLQLPIDGSAVAINEDGMVAGTVAGAAALVRDGTVQPLCTAGATFGTFEVIGSDARAINPAGCAAGTVYGPVEVGGPRNNRAATYGVNGEVNTFEIPGWTDTQSMAINAAGTVLVLMIAALFDVRSVLWRPEDGSWSYVGGNDAANVFPIALSNDGTVLGQVQQGADKVAVLCRPRGQWELLGTDPGWPPSAMNNRGDVLGHVTIDFVMRPWVRTHTGQMVMLPFYREHSCMATRINDEGHAIGSAGADHGSHALLWGAARRLDLCLNIFDSDRWTSETAIVPTSAPLGWS